ncbi:hypothetical protein RCL_jg2202.t1 [Rhizophagus clarus]|uniref:Uncharacterized protein n=1 Tax=Rhizophagus clarus TaxID=94130 RepID=A0A8H3KNZ7_9GLOM|nr:hypothetical protein RCL_jg2202.t1 [Rhizophagus clarus]
MLKIRNLVAIKLRPKSISEYHDNYEDLQVTMINTYSNRSTSNANQGIIIPKQDQLEINDSIHNLHMNFEETSKDNSRDKELVETIIKTSPIAKHQNLRAFHMK